MFTAKRSSLFPKTQAVKETSGTSNPFVNAGLNEQKRKAAVVASGNGAMKYSTTNNSFVDEFGQCGNYKKPRDFAAITASMGKLWNEDPLTAVKFAFYLRTITRVVDLPTGEKTTNPQRGQGLKHEGIFRMIWLAVNAPETFWKNIPLFVAVGSWKDIITMLSYDLQYNGWEGRKLDWNQFGQLILAGLENPKTSELIKKYLPQIKPNSKCKTVEAQADNIIAKWICSLLFGNKENSYNYKQYRKLKVSGTAHQWQQLISKKEILSIDFNSIHGRALSLLVSGKFLKNNGLESSYEKWLESKPTAKYTGYVYELTSGIKSTNKKYQDDTINKQFMELVEKAKKNAVTGTSMIVVRDTSGSMSSAATGTKISCYDVAKSLALFFSYMLPKGHFADSWIEFNYDAKMHVWKGATPVERWKNDRSSYVGSTNFQSVINLFVNIKRQGVPESEFPSGILCISDSEFDPSALGKTNVESALSSLRKAGFSEEYVSNFKIVLWNLGNSYYGRISGNKFETFGTGVPNVFYFSGLDGSTVAFLTGQEGQSKVPQNAQELFAAAMDQEILNMIEL